MSSYLNSTISNDGRLVAVVVPKSTSTSSTPASSSKRLRIQIYQVTSSTSSCTLQQTLTATTTTTAAGKRIKLLFASTNSNILIALIGTKEIITWDLTRGVVAETIYSTSKQGRKGKDDDDGEEQDDETVPVNQFLDIAVPVDDGTSSSSSTKSSQQQPPELFVLVSTPSRKLYTYEYVGSKLIRKIKSGKIESSSTTTTNLDYNNNGQLAVSATHIVVKSPDMTSSSSIRCMKRDTGSKEGKLKLKHGKNFAHSTTTKSNMMICPNRSNIVLTVLQDNNNTKLMALHDIVKCETKLEQFVPSSKNVQETSSLGGALSSSNFPVQILSSRSKNNDDEDIDETSVFTLLINQTLYNVDTVAATGGKSSSLSLDIVSQIMSSTSSPMSLLFVPTVQKLLVLDYPASSSGSGGECSSYWYSIADPTEISKTITIGDETTKDSRTTENKQDDVAVEGKKRKAVAGGSSAVVLGPGQAGLESRTVKEQTPQRKKIRLDKKQKKVTDGDDDDEDVDEKEDDTTGDDVGKKKKKKKKTKDDDDEDDDDIDTDDDDEMEQEPVFSGQYDDEEEDEEDDKNALSIAERLEALQKAFDEEEYKDLLDDDVDDSDDDDDDKARKKKLRDDKAVAESVQFTPKRATTESLVELLTQALNSNNDALLELALHVRDTTVITKTLSELQPQTLLVTLLGKLTTRLASSPLRAQQLVLWLSPCLKQGHIQRNLFNSKQVASLRNLLHERMESFQDLVQLEGRLSMMVE